MASLLYLSHPQVAIDPKVAVPDWGLSPLGRSRSAAFAGAALLPWTAGLPVHRVIWSSAALA